MAQPNGDNAGNSAVLHEILASLKSLQQENAALVAAVDTINGRVNVLAGVKQTKDGIEVDSELAKAKQLPSQITPITSPSLLPADLSSSPNGHSSMSPPPAGRKSSIASKIILTSYPGQAGVDPLPMNWGSKDPIMRGPVVVSRNHGTIRRRNGRTRESLWKTQQLMHHSHWRTRRLLCHLPRSCRCQQEP